MAGDEIRIAQNGFIMLHSARFGSRGGTAESNRRKTPSCSTSSRPRWSTSTRRRSKQTKETVATWLEAETWFDAREAWPPAWSIVSPAN